MEFFVFGNFTAEEAGRNVGFVFEAGWSQDVGVAGFVGALFEVSGLDPAFGDQDFEAVVDFAEADAEIAGEFALGDVGGFFEAFEELVGYGVVEFGDSHGLYLPGFILGVQFVNWVFIHVGVIMQGIFGFFRDGGF